MMKTTGSSSLFLANVGEALRSIARYCRLCDPELAMSFEIEPQAGG